MSKYYLSWLVPLMLTAAGAGLLTGWIYSYYALSVPMRLPGEDGRPDVSLPQTAAGATKQGHLETFDGIPSQSAGVWPTFRGIHYDAVSTESVPLMRSFPPGGPKELWLCAMASRFCWVSIRCSDPCACD